MDRRKFLGSVAGAATVVAAPRLALAQASKMSVLLGTAPPDVALRSATPGYLGLISILTNTKIQWDPEEQRILNNPAAERLLSRPMRGPWHI